MLAKSNGLGSGRESQNVLSSLLQWGCVSINKFWGLSAVFDLGSTLQNWRIDMLQNIGLHYGDTTLEFADKEPSYTLSNIRAKRLH